MGSPVRPRSSTRVRAAGPSIAVGSGRPVWRGLEEAREQDAKLFEKKRPAGEAGLFSRYVKTNNSTDLFLRKPPLVKHPARAFNSDCRGSNYRIRRPNRC